MNQISKIQYISQGATATEQLSNIQKVLDHGASWVQLRYKDAEFDKHLSLARRVKELCESYKATLIINDHIDIATQVNACGVHLGQQDTDIQKAREILGDSKIIGATANTLQQVIQVSLKGCDYIGLGPYAFTKTKQNLSPILALQGYRDIIQTLKSQQVYLKPIVAIGGIALRDIPSLLETGVHGVALSGLLTKDPKSIYQIKQVL